MPPFSLHFLISWESLFFLLSLLLNELNIHCYRRLILKLKMHCCHLLDWSVKQLVSRGKYDGCDYAGAWQLQMFICTNLKEYWHQQTEDMWSEALPQNKQFQVPFFVLDSWSNCVVLLKNRNVAVQILVIAVAVSAHICYYRCSNLV